MITASDIGTKTQRDKNMNQGQVVGQLFKDHFGGQEKVVGVEIGTKCSDLTCAILLFVPQAFVYTIDPWEHRDKAEFEAGEPQEYHDKNKEFAYKRLSNHENRHRVFILPFRSSYAIDLIPPEKVDFVWTDGDHSEAGIRADIELYYPLVKDGGIFGGHDYGQCHPLTEVIKERFGDRLNVGDDFTWWVIK